MNNLERVQDLYAAFGRGDIPAVLERFDAGIRWSEAESNPYQPSGEAWIGPEAVLEHLFARLGAEWDAFNVDPLSYHDAGETIVVEGRYTGTFLATGEQLDAQACHVWRFRDGLVTSFQQFADTARLRAAMGV